MTRRAAGFTLIEVLVALIIAGLALGALFAGSVSGMESVRLATHYEDAISRARSHLAALTALDPTVGVTQNGDDGGGFHWEAQEFPMGTDIAPPRAAQPLLIGVRVTISWRMDGGTRSVTLHSEKLGAIAPSSP